MSSKQRRTSCLDIATADDFEEDTWGADLSSKMTLAGARCVAYGDSPEPSNAEFVLRVEVRLVLPQI